MIQPRFHWCCNCTSLIKLNATNTKCSSLYKNIANVKEGGCCVFTHVLVFPVLLEWFWPLSVWPLKSEKMKRDCPRLKGSFSQFTQNEHTHM